MSGKDCETNESIVDSEAALLSNPAEPSSSSSNLNFLTNAKHYIVRQQRDIRETLRGTEEPNVYWVLDKATGEKLFHVQEDVDCCRQQCCGAKRPFKLRVYDKFKREVMLFDRPISCDWLCGWGCCLDQVNVSVRNFRSRNFEWYPVGYVKQSWNPIFPTFNICDPEGNIQCKIKGPFLTCGFFTTVNFSIETEAGHNFGTVSKYWYGFCTELTSDVDLFEIRFGGDGVDEKTKATLLGALFLIDFKYYES